MTVNDITRIGKHLRIKEIDSITSKKRFNVKTIHNEILGQIEFLYRWDQYVYVSLNACFYSWDCLQDISKYLKVLNDSED